jgi:hypothetical protein
MALIKDDSHDVFRTFHTSKERLITKLIAHVIQRKNLLAE